MHGLFAAFPLLLAEGQAAPNGSSSLMVQLLPFLPVVVLFYFLILRPQQQMERKKREMLGALKKNDRVITSGGIYGTVVSVDSDADKVVLRVDDDRGTKITFSRAAVTRVLEEAPAKAAEAV